MALIRCPECQRQVSDKASSCPNCGYPLSGTGGGQGGESGGPGAWPGGRFPFEYKSSATIFGMPLIHIVYGPAWGGGLKPARGFIAIGNIAIGVIAIGGLAAGVLTLAGIGIGLVTIAGIALGIGLGVGGVATGYFAVGGLAIGVYAIGGLAIGQHTLFNDPAIMEKLRRVFHFRN